MKTLKILVFALFLLGGAYVAWSWHLSTHNAKWLWCENYEGIRTGKGEEGTFGGFRMHMCPKADSLWMVSGSSQGFAHIDSCFAFLQSHPWCRVWIVADSLDARNFDSFLYSVIGSATRHEVEPVRIVVETDRWDLMRKLTLLSVHTAYAWEAPLPSTLSEQQKDSVVTRIHRIASSGQVNTLIVSRAWYPYFHGQLKGLDVGFLVYEPTRSAFSMMLDPMSRVMLKDSQVIGMLTCSTNSGS